jgi:hypothetical protein
MESEPAEGHPEQLCQKTMRVDLQIPFDEKDSAKLLGAQWDVARRTWYVIDPEDLSKFAKWMGEDVQNFYFQKKPQKGKMATRAKLQKRKRE